MYKRAIIAFENTVKLILAVFVLTVVIIGIMKFGIVAKWFVALFPSFETDKDVGKGENLQLPLKTGDEMKFNVISEYPADNKHTLKILDVSSSGALIEIFSDPIIIELILGESKKIDVNGDGFYDLILTLTDTDLEKEIAYTVVGYTFEEVDYSNPLELNEENYYNKLLGANPNLEEFQDYDSRYRISNGYPTDAQINDRADYWKGYDEYISTENFQVPNSYSWVDSLPVRDNEVNLNSDKLQEYLKQEELGYAPCGTFALYKAINILGVPVQFEEINNQRSGGFWRGFLSIFSGEAKYITWPSEIRSISENYGLDVMELSDEEATIDNVRKFSDEDSVVILHTVDSLFAQHYHTYDTNEVRRVAKLNVMSSNIDQIIRNAEMDFPDWTIKNVYILSKK